MTPQYLKTVVLKIELGPLDKKDAEARRKDIEAMTDTQIAEIYESYGLETFDFVPF